MNNLGETTVVKSLATAIHSRLVNPTEEHYKKLDLKINNLLNSSKAEKEKLRQELNQAIENIMLTKTELDRLSTSHKNISLLSFIAIVITLINFIAILTK
ncbi:hypothetical protein Dtox_1730 [Desulfofarcimen acetoxidans DSM 771]|uniref:Uncharacterized protein n=1 Tax=Desulfofarcimen acetoxidans (strain ATCC 49208 / DSM 771 / KCTC 5769 / VKM B-1644 / 5575) TaxID=485916 RepID=C8VX11_DESAS|nr:hypothetical protein [Desulfofarcimen acetoxidans]ACV62587.1 hypothetical protein Dtox_1730 [Desulfofarcimen acetoxidans DSM 771]